MPEYVENLNVNDYYYREPIYITEMGGIDRTDYIVRLTFSSDDFNFSQARRDGKDFKLSESSNGSSVLYMWRSVWDQTNGLAVLWFRLPKLLANETKTLYAFWGNSSPLDVSDINNIDLIFSDGFDNNVINSSVWGFNSPSFTYAAYNYSVTPTSSSYYMYTMDNILTGISSWEITMGCYYGSPTQHTQYYLNYFYFGGNENFFGLKIYPEGNTDVVHSAVDGSEVTYNGLEKGMEEDSNCILTFRYYEPTDTFYFGMSNRNTYDDYLDSWERKVEGDTRLDYLRIYGKYGSNPYNYIDWIAVREFLNDDPIWDITGLYNRYGDIVSQYIDLTAYGNDLTDESYYHISSIGGDPNKMSDNGTSSLDKVWYSDENYGFNFKSGMLCVDSFSNSTSLDEYTIRQFIPSTTISGFAEKVKLVLENSGGWSFDNCFIGYSSTTDEIYSFDGNNTQVTFNSGDYGATLGSSDLESDEFVFDFDSEKDIIVSFDISSSSTSIPYANSYGYNSYYKDTSTVREASFIDVSGYTAQNDRLYCVKEIKIREPENIIIDFGRSLTNLVSSELDHFDNNHVNFYNASKLSDNASDINGRDYWNATTTSGVWAAVDFGSTNKQIVGCFSVKAVSSNLKGMVKNYKFEGTNDDPRTIDLEWDTIHTGFFKKSPDWQSTHFVNGKKYQYYRLYVIDTYGENLSLQEWGMYSYNSSFSKKTISQLRLRPITFSSGEYYFPRNILFYGSNDMVNWTNIIPLTRAYTPFMETGEFERWHRYSFTNTTPYWCYKLEFTSNWNSEVDRIGMSEWEMVESELEEITYRVLIGTDNNISNVSADDGFTFTGGTLHASIDTVLNIIVNDKFSNYEVWEKEIKDVNVI
jgi:hypothetical protein